MRHLLISLFLPTAIISAAAAIDTSALASTRSFSSHSCYAVSGSTGSGSNVETSTSDDSTFQVYNPGTNSGLTLLCPVVSDSNISAHASTVAANVHGWANSGSQLSNCPDGVTTQGVGIKACRIYHDGSGGSCGGYTSPATSHVYDPASPNVSATWTATGASDSDGYAIQVYLGCTISGSNNTLFSYDITN